MNQLQVVPGNLSINIEILNFWVLVGLLVLLAIYSTYSLIVMTQVRILNKSIHTDNARLLNILAVAHLLASLFLFVIVILLLLV